MLLLHRTAWPICRVLYNVTPVGFLQPTTVHRASPGKLLRWTLWPSLHYRPGENYKRYRQITLFHTSSDAAQKPDNDGPPGPVERASSLKTRCITKQDPHTRSRSPSATLIESFKSAGYPQYDPQKIIGRKPVDHSYISAQELHKRRSRSGRDSYPTYFEDAHGVPTEDTLQSVLANYVRFCLPTYVDQGQNSHTCLKESSLAQAFDNKSLQFLAQRGYDAEDVVTWGWILAPEDSYTSALRLLAATNNVKRTSKAPVPTFVFLFLLRRARISISALKLLISHGWDRLENRVNPQWSSALIFQSKKPWHLSQQATPQAPPPTYVEGRYPALSEQTIVIMVVRLLRQASQWPAAIPSIVDMLTSHVVKPHERGDGNSITPPFQSISRLTFLFNRLLTLIAKQVSSPFLSINYQERAQFNVIRKMAEFEPPLTVSREGYQAVVRVQLAHRKTLAERHWSYLKSKAWPPWREDKLGIDAGKSNEIGISRANRALRSLKESGYSAGIWEDAAGILSGWDTDQSPTIQKRTTFSPSFGTRFLQSGSTETTPYMSIVWEARIRATRTVNEAWACFLAYREEADLHASVYAAMLEKIVFEDKRKHSGESNTVAAHDTEFQGSRPVSGDMLEVEAPSTNPREMTYTRTAPPDFTDFVNAMLEKGIEPRGRLLSLMLRNAKTLGDGFRFLRASCYPSSCVSSLIGAEKLDESALRDLPRSVFTAFVVLLTRFPRSHLTGTGYRNTLATSTQPYRPAISHAIELVTLIEPPYAAPWNALLSAVAENNIVLNKVSNDVVSKQLDCWASLVSIVQRMEGAEVRIDFDTFHVLCEKLQKICRHARASGIKLGLEVDNGSEGSLSNTAFIILLKQGLAKLKRTFKNLVSLDLNEDKIRSASVPAAPATPKNTEVTYSASSVLPELLQIPSPAHVHVFMRAIGTMRDYDGILDLLRWMAYAAPELEVVSQELRNGSRLFRFALISARVYLERSWATVVAHDDMKHEEAAPQEAVDEARSIIERVEDWGGWPTDDEVAEYCRKGHWTF